jgi:hypothetical protein
MDEARAMVLRRELTPSHLISADAQEWFPAAKIWNRLRGSDLPSELDPAVQELFNAKVSGVAPPMRVTPPQAEPLSPPPTPLKPLHVAPPLPRPASLKPLAVAPLAPHHLDPLPPAPADIKPPPEPPPPKLMPAFDRDVLVLKGTTAVLLVLIVGVFAASLFELYLYGEALRFLANVELKTQIAQPAVDGFRRSAAIFFAINLLIFLSTATVFLFWLFRTSEALFEFGVDGMRYSSGAAIGWWFVPIARLWKPFQVVREVWDAAASSSRRHWASPEPHPLLLAWWGLWLITTWLLPYTIAAFELFIDSVGDLQLFVLLQAANALGRTALACVFFALVLRLALNFFRKVGSRQQSAAAVPVS